MLSIWIISFSASLLPSLHLQYGCTALQTAPGKRPQVALCVFVNMLKKLAPLRPYCGCAGQTCLSFFLLLLSLSFPPFNFFKLACAVILHSFHPPSPSLQSCRLSLLSQSQALTLKLDWSEVSHLILCIWLQCDSKCEGKTTAYELIHASSLQVNISIKKHLPIPLQIAMCILTQTQSQISASWWIFSGTFHCNCGIPGKKTTRAFGASIRTISSSVRVRGKLVILQETKENHEQWAVIECTRPQDSFCFSIRHWWH